jgi:TRAP-type C4-dicarboxylate transport system permease small subunit
MGRFFRSIEKINKVMDAVGSCVLLFMMLLTAADVILRYLKMPIVGTYELVSFAGALVVGCALPQTSWQRTHVTVDIVTDKMSKGRLEVLQVTTRLMSMGLFILLGWNILDMARTLYETGESSMTLTIPLYPLAIALAICCIIECLVLLLDIGRVVVGGGQNE